MQDNEEDSRAETSDDIKNPENPQDGDENDLSEAMADLIREFESFQADPEPIPGPEDIARMEEQEKAEAEGGSADDPSVPATEEGGEPSVSDESDSEAETGNKETQDPKPIEPVADSGDQEDSAGLEPDESSDPAVAAEDDNKLTKESAVANGNDNQDSVSETEDLAADTEYATPAPVEEVSSAEAESQEVVPDRKEVAKDRDEEPVNSEKAEENAAFAQLPAAAGSSNPINELDQDQVGKTLVAHADEPVFAGDNPLSEFAALAFPQSSNVTNRTILSVDEGLILWNVLTNLYVVFTHFIQSLISLKAWKRRFSSLTKGLGLRQFVLPDAEGDPVSIKIFHRLTGNPVCQVSVHADSSFSPNRNQLKWRADVEGTAQILWREEESFRNNPISKSHHSGASSLIYQSGNCGAVCHFRAQSGSREAVSFKRLVNNLEDSHSDLFLDKPGGPEAFQSIDLLDQEVTSFIQNKRQEVRKPNAFGTLSLLAIIGMTLWGAWGDIKSNASFEKSFAFLVHKLEKEPGIQIVHARNKEISVLKDPHAASTQTILIKSGLEGKVSVNSVPFQSNDAEMVIRRVMDVLNPPSDVSVAVSKNTLFLAGYAPDDWIQKSKILAPLIPGVNRVSDLNLKPELPDLPQQSANLTTPQLVDGKIQKISKEYLTFQSDTATLSEGEHAKLDDLLKRVMEVFQMSRSIGLEPKVEIIGFASTTEFIKFGSEIGFRRAEAIKSFLKLKGLDIEKIVTASNGKRPPISKSTPPNSASIRISLQQPE